jgi:hypothetical protein
MKKIEAKYLDVAIASVMFVGVVLKLARAINNLSAKSCRKRS